MSENKTTKEQSVITLDKFESLKDKIYSKDLLIHELSTKEAELRTELKLLKDQKEEKEPMVKVVTQTNQRDSFAFNVSKESIEYKNMQDLKLEAKEKATKEVEKELQELKRDKERLQDELKKLNREQQDIIDDAKYSYERKASENKKYYQERTREAIELYDKFKEDKVKQINKLKKELEEERNNKTDKELESKRKEEIQSYKKLIAKLETRLEKYEKLNWFQKAVAKLGNVKADKEVAEEIAELKNKLRNYDNTNIFSGRHYYNPQLPGVNDLF